MRVLITGVAGFVGNRLAGYLRDQGHEVIGTYLESPPDLPGVELYDVDMLDEELVRQTVQRAAPEAVIHLAGLSHVGDSWSRPADYFRVNVLGTEALLRAVGGVRLLAASSAEVYGFVPETEQPISEVRQIAPQSPYALTKAAMERLILPAGAVVARSFNIIGPGQAPSFALPAFARQLAAMRAGRQEQVLSVGNLTARRDFIHLDDAVRAYDLLLRKGEGGRSYNLGSGTAHSMRQVLDRLIAVSGVAPEVREDPDKMRPVDLPLLRADTRRLRDLGWRPQHSLDQALERLWLAARAQEADEGGHDTEQSKA
jgi:GDP-4-dehydro-6-deoxy-D-mannose reductase